MSSLINNYESALLSINRRTRNVNEWLILDNDSRLRGRVVFAKPANSTGGVVAVAWLPHYDKSLHIVHWNVISRAYADPAQLMTGASYYDPTNQLHHIMENPTWQEQLTQSGWTVQQML